MRNMTTAVSNSMKSLNHTFEARKSEWILTGMLLSLSVTFFLNEEMFERETFSGLREIIENRNTWGFILALVGITRLTVLGINGAYWRTPHLRSLTAFLSMGVWFLLCAGLLENMSLGVAIMPWVLILDGINTKTAAKEAGKSEFLQRYKRQELLNAGLGSNT